MSKKCLIFCIFVKKISFLNPQCVEKIVYKYYCSLKFAVRCANSKQCCGSQIKKNCVAGPGSKILLAWIRFLPRKFAFGSWLQDFASSDPVLTKKNCIRVLAPRFCQLGSGSYQEKRNSQTQQFLKIINNINENLSFFIIHLLIFLNFFTYTVQ